MHFFRDGGPFLQFRPGRRRLRGGPEAALADAAATALGNRVPDAGAIAAALDWVATVPEILGAVVIVGEKLGAWGEVELVPLT